MGAASFVQSAFSGGEWAKAAQGRYHDPAYGTAMALCRNGVPTETDAWVRRPGFRAKSMARMGRKCKLAKFDFSERSPMHLEFTDGFLRFHDEGVLKLEDAITIVSISGATPAVITTGTHGFTTGNSIVIEGVASTCPALDRRQFLVTVLSSTTFSIADAVTGASIDGALASAFASGTVRRIYELATIYGGTSWRDVKVVQANRNLEHKAYLLAKKQIYELSSDDDAETFELTKAQLLDGPYLDPMPTGSLATPSAKTGIINVTLSFSAYAATKAYKEGDYVTYSSVNYKSLQSANLNHQPDISATWWVEVASTDPIGPDGLQATDIGRHVRLYSEPPLWLEATSYVAGDTVSHNDVQWTAKGSSTGKIPGKDTTNWEIASNAAIWSWGRITALLNQIDQTVSGAVNIGDFTSFGGLAAAFDGQLAQASNLCAVITGSPLSAITGYIGREFGGGAEAIGWATLHPPANCGIFSTAIVSGSTLTHFEAAGTMTVKLRGKNGSAPANREDGTLLGTTTTTVASDAITVTSNDTATTWDFVWFDISAEVTAAGFGLSAVVAISEAQFFSPPTATGNGFSLELLGDDLLYTSPVRTWRLGVYSDSTGWPKCGTWRDGRLWLAGPVKNRVDASMSNDPLTFSPTNKLGQVLDNSGISYTFNSTDATEIYWMQPDLRGIVCGTSRGEWLIRAASNQGGISPTNIDAERDTRTGAADIDPETAEQAIVYVQSAKRKIVEHFSDAYSGKYAAPTLNWKAKHLTKGGIAGIAYQQELVPTLWVHTALGELVGVTYKRDTMTTAAAPTLMGFHKHPMTRDVEQVSCGRSSNGSLAVTLAVTCADIDSDVDAEDGTNTRWIEMLSEFPEEGDAVASSCYLDFSMAPSAVAVGAAGYSILSGFMHLAGETVSVTKDGVDLGTFTVSATGTVTVTGNPQGDFLVGHAYTSEGQLLRPFLPQDTGAGPSSAFGKTRRVHNYALQVVEGANILEVGTSSALLVPVRFRKPSNVAYSPRLQELFSGIHWDSFTDSPSFDGMLYWRATRPGPVMLTAAGGFVRTEDRV